MRPANSRCRTCTDREADLGRIRAALEAASAQARVLLSSRTPATDGRTALDLHLDELLRELLVRDREGWLSEETEDDHARLQCARIWVVDAVDGTRELMQGLPEWCISIGLVEHGRVVAGGVCNPSTGELFLGSMETGLRVWGVPAQTAPWDPQRIRVLASRTEFARGDWAEVNRERLLVRPLGSIAYKLARVAAGLADATRTQSPRHEWDVAGGVALVMAAGGWVTTSTGETPSFNRPLPLLPGIVAFSRHARCHLSPAEMQELLAPVVTPSR